MSEKAWNNLLVFISASGLASNVTEKASGLTGPRQLISVWLEIQMNGKKTLVSISGVASAWENGKNLGTNIKNIEFVHHAERIVTSIAKKLDHF